MSKKLTNEELSEIWEKSFNKTKNPDERFNIFDRDYKDNENADQILTSLFYMITNVLVLSYDGYEYQKNAFKRDTFATCYKKNIYRLDKDEHPFYWAFNGLLNGSNSEMNIYAVLYIDKLLRLRQEDKYIGRDPEGEFVWDFVVPFKNGYRGFWKDIFNALTKRDIPDDWKIWIEYANVLNSFYESDKDKRGSVLESYIKQNPNTVFFKELLGWVCYDNKVYVGAKQYWEETDSNPLLLEGIDRYWKMAWLYSKLKDYENEEKYYRLYWGVNPEFTVVRNNLGNCLYNQGRYDEAEELFLDCIERGEDLAYAPNNYVRLLLKNQRAEEARTFMNSGKYKISKDIVKRLEKLEEKIRQEKKTNHTKNNNKKPRKYYKNQELSTSKEETTTEGAKSVEKTAIFDSDDFIEVTSNGTVSAKQGVNTRIPYRHQKTAIENLNVIDELDDFSTLVVLPTGGGKTYTASTWLLKNALNKHKKILWIAHRHMLLDQAAESFQKFAYSEVLSKVNSFNYRIVSGATEHDRMKDILPTDNLLIVSKGSLGKNLGALDVWLQGENVIYLVIDEAHHSTAKTYRKVIDYVRSKVKHVKLIGLTATPFRTAENEQGLLSKIFKDGVSSGKAVTNDKGITYQIGLKELISQMILSKPIFESYYTDENYGKNLGINAWEKISNMDILPDDIAGQMAESTARNKLIVETYKKKQKEYGKTIVFAYNVIHAIQLAKQFNNAGIRADFIISDTRDKVTGVTTSSKDNEWKIEAFRHEIEKDGKKIEYDVLVNVNILTEGIDLPQTKTVFLARPTVSTILMTQMIGRALRGKSAGGTENAYIVSFIDNWNEHIAWVNPENLFIGEENDFSDDPIEYQNHEMRLIAISKIEEFASILDASVDTTALEKVPFEKRIPIGMYAFTCLEENGMDHSYQVMIYDSTREAYEDMMHALPELFRIFGVDDEFVDKDAGSSLRCQIEDTYFTGEMIPPYDKSDIVHILKYYAQYEDIPRFYEFKDIPLGDIDVKKIAKHIWDEHMDMAQKAEYVNSIWENTDKNILKIFFGRKIYFWRQIDIEIMKLSGIYDEEDNVTKGRRYFEDMPLYEIRKYDPEYEKELRDGAFAKALNQNGEWVCSNPKCGFASKFKVNFHVDHIVPLNNKGGKTVPENLQILCRKCNLKKGDKLKEIAK